MSHKNKTLSPTGGAGTTREKQRYSHPGVKKVVALVPDLVGSKQRHALTKNRRTYWVRGAFVSHLSFRPLEHRTFEPGIIMVYFILFCIIGLSCSASFVVIDFIRRHLRKTESTSVHLNSTRNYFIIFCVGSLLLSKDVNAADYYISTAIYFILICASSPLSFRDTYNVGSS